MLNPDERGGDYQGKVGKILEWVGVVACIVTFLVLMTQIYLVVIT